jgi:AP-3 complex subunit beta
VEFLSAVIRCIGRIAEKVPSVGARSLNGLLVLVHSPAPPVVASTVIVIRQLLQQAQQIQREKEAKLLARGGSRGRAASAASEASDADSGMNVDLAVRRLVRMLSIVEVPAARASLVWILGEFQDLIPKRAPDILRQLAQGFCDEHVDVKMQIMNAAVKLSLKQPKKKVVGLLRTYILDLARYDTEPDLRDRANVVLRMLASEQMGTSDVLFAVKQSPSVHGMSGGAPKFVIGSLSHTVAHAARGYKPLPPFTTSPSDPLLREMAEEDKRDRSTHFGSDSSPKRDTEVSFLLCTVTFYANLAHSLTRSP